MPTYGKGYSIYAAGGATSTTSGSLAMFTVPAGCFAELQIMSVTATGHAEITGVAATPASGTGRYIFGPGAVVHVSGGGSSVMNYTYVIFQNS